jgi:hypothetical protein
MNPLLFGPIFEIIKQVLGGLGLDPALKEKAQAQALDVLTNGTFDQKAAQAVTLAQIGVNNTEAQSQSLFKSGWRPAIGWTCVGALFSQYIIKPWVQWFALISGNPLPEMPGIDDQLWQLMGGMLGMGALRTYEKIQGKS